MACRVVCGRLLTMPTFSPTRAFVSVVLPAFGRPTRQAKPLRYGGRSGGVTPSSLPLRTDSAAAPGSSAVLRTVAPVQPGAQPRDAGRTAWDHGRMPPRSRRERGEPLVVGAAVGRERHVSQVTSYGYFARRGPKRHVTVTPRPLRYWQYDPARWWVLAVT